MALALLCLVLFLAVGVVLLLVPGAALIGVLFLLVAVAAAIWAVVALLTGGSVGVVMRWPRKPELLGPGGPDDPDVVERDAPPAEARESHRSRG